MASGRRSSVPGWPWQPRHAFLALPVGLIGAVTAVDLLVPSEVHLGPVLVAAPAVTAAIGGPRLVVSIGALATLAQLMIGVVRRGWWLTLNHQTQILAVIIVTAATAAFAALRERDQRKMTQMRSVSRAAQRVVIPPLPRRLGPLSSASFYLAAEAEAHIGGDLYAAVRAAGRTRVLIGDVRGKGLGATRASTMLIGSFRAGAHQEDDIGALAYYLDRCVSRDLSTAVDTERHRDEDFITAIVLEIPDDEHVVRLVSCGHPPPLLVRAGRVTPLLSERPGTPLGLGELAGAEYHAETIPMGADATLLLYTDGVTEARRKSGVFYPLTERVPKAVGYDPQTLVQWLRHDLLSYCGGSLTDDAALVALQRSAP